MSANHIKTTTIRLTHLLFCALLFLGCKKDNGSSNNLNITNQSGADVVLVNMSTGERLPINNGDVKLISSALKIADFVIEGTSGNTRTFEFEAKGDQKYIIYGYEYFLQYKISGESKEAHIAFINDSGQKIDVPKVPLPYYISYKKFPGKKYFLDVENLGQTGFIALEVIIKEKVISELSAPKRASTSGNVDGTAVYD